jgi:hypothetical protein
MAYGGRILETTLTAGEDLNTGCQYHAIALDDGKLAANAEEASGILINKPKTGEGLTLGYIGEQKFAAGAAIAKGAKLTVTTSGWFTTADSNDVVIGECKVAVTSGSLGTGLFAFPQATGNFPENLLFNLALKDTVVAGVAIDIVTAAPGATGRDCNAVSQSAGNSGTAYNLLLWGKGQGRVGGAASLGDNLTTTTSGYFTLCASGYYSTALALGTAASGQLIDMFFFGGYVGYKPTSWN